MFDQAWEFVQSQLHTNQFLAGGFVLGLIAGVLHFFKALPGKAWDRLKSYFFIEVEIEDKDEAFGWMLKWLAAHPYSSKKARRLSATTERTEDNRDPRPKIILSPARGQHWFMYRGRLVILNRNKDESGESAGAKASKDNWMKPETISVKVLGRRREVIRELIEEARELVHPKGERRLGLMIYNRYNGWNCKSHRRPRQIESVILRAGLMEDMLAQIAKFRAEEDWYIARGIPYRLGILYIGPPGSGKSSSIAAVASHFDMDLAIINLANGGFDDDDVRCMLSDVPKNTLTMMEDIDCVFNQREKSEDDESKVTFSGLLNAIDGVAAGEGRILVMTTNHPEKLDAALTRAGRADLKYEIGHPDDGQVCRMYGRFFPNATDSQTLRFVQAIGTPEKTSMAALQGVLLKYRNDAEAAITHAKEVFETLTNGRETYLPVERKPAVCKPSN